MVKLNYTELQVAKEIVATGLSKAAESLSFFMKEAILLNGTEYSFEEAAGTGAGLRLPTPRRGGALSLVDARKCTSGLPSVRHGDLHRRAHGRALRTRLERSRSRARDDHPLSQL